MRTRLLLSNLILALLLAPDILAAQGGAPPFALGPTGGFPSGAFGQRVNFAWGVEFSGILPVGPPGIFGLRADLGFQNYGNEHSTVPLFSSNQRALVDLNTYNRLLSLSVGPQLTFGRSALKPYLMGAFGVSYFFTESDASGSSSTESFASTTNFDDWTMLLEGGGGVYINLSRAHNVALDLSLRYQHNATVRYLTKGDLTTNPDGTISFQPSRSGVDLVVIRVAVAFSPRKDTP